MYKKFLIIASKKNPAAMNVVKNLNQFRENPIMSSMNDSQNFDILITEEEVLFEENLPLEKIEKYDFIIFPCTHRSDKGVKSLSVHSPGNWRTGGFGGREGKVSRASALFNKVMFENLIDTAKKFDLNDFEITLECTHHGPSLNKPCVFIEIGSSENEWGNRRAGFVIAKTISKTIYEYKENPYREIAIGIGGPHYCPNFNKIQSSSNFAISHIIPSYVAPITEEMIREAVEKTDEELDFVLLDWKGLGVAEERQKVIAILEKNYIPWKKTSDISKS